MQQKFKYGVFIAISLIPHLKYNICFAQQPKQKDTIVTVFYNSQIQPIPDTDSNNASYYRVIKYRDGNVFGAVNDFYKNGNEGCSRYSIVEKIKNRNREKFIKEKYIKIRFIEVVDSIFMYCYR